MLITRHMVDRPLTVPLSWMCSSCDLQGSIEKQCFRNSIIFNSHSSLPLLKIVNTVNDRTVKQGCV